MKFEQSAIQNYEDGINLEVAKLHSKMYRRSSYYNHIVSCKLSFVAEAYN